MRVSVLSSGSKGNSTYVELLNHKILIDIGTSSLYIEKALNISVFCQYTAPDFSAII